MSSMGRRLSPHQAELYRRTDEILHFVWDPVGIAGEAAARDEYDSYVPQVFSLLERGADEQAIADFLLDIEREWTGKGPAKSTEVARMLIEHREWIAEMR